jgi:uncharacterized membrane protein
MIDIMTLFALILVILYCIHRGIVPAIFLGIVCFLIIFGLSITTGLMDSEAYIAKEHEHEVKSRINVYFALKESAKCLEYDRMYIPIAKAQLQKLDASISSPYSNNE